MSNSEHNSQANKDFSAFEKEALETSSNDALKLDLQRYLNKLHREQREDIEERISAIEKRCNEEIRKTLEKHVKIQIETHFKETLKALQVQVLQLCSPLMRKAEEDVSRLQLSVSKTNMLCHDIQEKYSFRWEKPFLLLIAGTALTGAFMGVGLLLLQVGPLAVFLMNEDTRMIYERGKNGQKIQDLSRYIDYQIHEIKNLKKKGKPSQ
jgi:hypothetical protein